MHGGLDLLSRFMPRLRVSRTLRKAFFSLCLLNLLFLVSSPSLSPTFTSFSYPPPSPASLFFLYFASLLPLSLALPPPRPYLLSFSFSSLLPPPFSLLFIFVFLLFVCLSYLSPSFFLRVFNINSFRNIVVLIQFSAHLFNHGHHNKHEDNDGNALDIWF